MCVFSSGIEWHILKICGWIWELWRQASLPICPHQWQPRCLLFKRNIVSIHTSRYSSTIAILPSSSSHHLCPVLLAFYSGSRCSNERFVLQPENCNPTISFRHTDPLRTVETEELMVQCNTGLHTVVSAKPTCTCRLLGLSYPVHQGRDTLCLV